MGEFRNWLLAQEANGGAATMGQDLEGELELAVSQAPEGGKKQALEDAMKKQGQQASAQTGGTPKDIATQAVVSDELAKATGGAPTAKMKSKMKKK
jgi:hypothetical protein